MRKWIVTVLSVTLLIVACAYVRSWWPWLHERLIRKDIVDFLTSIGGIAAVLALVGGIIVWLFRQWWPEKEKRPANPPPAAPAPPGPTYITHINSPAVAAEKPVASALHQLPAPPADFTGRREEFNDLLTKVRLGGVAISGMHGMGGVGKTALALKLAEKLRADYPDAQIYLDLKGVSDRPVTPKEAMAHVIWAHDPKAQLPDDEVKLGALYRSLLDGKRVLLLMDNARDASQVQPLVPPTCCLLLVTSRHQISLPGLEEKKLDKLSSDDACELLLKVASRLKKEKPEEISELSHLCGFLPLALRAVGSALQEKKNISAADYIVGLSDAQQRLRITQTDAALEASYGLLTEPLKQRFRFLAVFSESFDAVAAAAIWETEYPDAKDSLGELLAYSLVEFDETSRRYRLHDLVRLFARQKLNKNVKEKTEIERRQGLHYLKVLASANQLYLKGGESVTKGLALLDLELGNIRTGQAWSASQAVSDQAAAVVCFNYLNAGAECLSLRQHPREGIKWQEAALAAARHLKQRRWEGIALGSLGIAYRSLGEYRRSIEYNEQYLTITREIGDRRGEGTALGNLGAAYWNLGEHWRAIEYHEKALQIDREMGDRRREGQDLGNLGTVYGSLGEHHLSIQFFEQHLATARESGDRKGEASALNNLGIAQDNLGEHPRAAECHEQALAIFREIGDRQGEGNALCNLGSVYGSLGEHRRAIQFFEQYLAIAREIGDRRGEGFALGNIGNTYRGLGERRRAMDYYDQALVIAREIRDREGEGLGLWNSALVLNELGARHEATNRAEVALGILEAIESPYAQRVREALGVWRGQMGKGATGQSS